MKNRKTKCTISFLTVALFVLFILIIASLCLGAVNVPISESVRAIFSFSEDSNAQKIVRFVRLPRTLAAILCGSSLSVSGAIVQTTLQNPLGSPSVLGMNAGAALFVIALSIFSASVVFLPLSAFLGAFLTLLAVLFMGKKAGGKLALSRSSVLLSGIAANAFLSALSDALNALVPDTVYSRSVFRIGSLSGVQMEIVEAAGVVSIVAIFGAILFSPALDILYLGDESARTLGLNTQKTRSISLILASILCGSAVSVAGLISFVGLIVPHVVRLFAKKNSSAIFISSAILGADLVLFCDLASRLVFAPYELPVGVPLSLLGGPFFFALLVKRRNGDAK